MSGAPDTALDGLRQTLEHARSSLPYYKELLAGGERPASLGDFPVIDAGLVSEWPERFYSLERFPDFILTTGGTTGRRPGFFPLNYEEVDLAFRAKLGDPEETPFDPEDFPGVALNLVDLQHGLVHPARHGQPVITLPLEVGRHLELVVRFLRDGLVVGGHRYPVLELAGSTTKLRALTAYCEAEGMAGEELGIRRITTLAFHASGSWRRRLGEYWQAEIATAYGLTEFSEAAAGGCRACGGFHLPETVHGEYLAAGSDDPVEAGTARLVLTSLFPYRQAMPLIRYDTGDLVEVLPPCALTLSRGFLFHGRRTAVLLGSDGEAQLTPLDVLEAVDELEDERPGTVRHDESVALVMSWGSGHGPATFRRAGYPVLNCEASGPGQVALRVTVEIEGHPGGREEAGAALRSHLRERQARRTGPPAGPPSKVELECLAPGGLLERDLPLTTI